MKIQILSDIHTEFQNDGGKSFFQSAKVPDADVLIIAGDLGVGTTDVLLEDLCSFYPHVVYVLGNHEFYRCSVPSVLGRMRRLCSRLENLHWLENDVVEVKGCRFVGTTLWFPENPKARSWLLNDFRLIRKFCPWVYERNQKSQRFLRETVKKGDVVVTHHIPCLEGSDPRWWNSPVQPFFLCDVQDVILQQRPQMWVYGHTHDSHDFQIGDTQLICNPLGYAGRGENPHFQINLVVHI